MPDNKYDVMHPYRQNLSSDEFLHRPVDGVCNEVIEVDTLKEFLLAREEAMKKLNEAFGDEPGPLHYSTQSFIDSLVSVPKVRAVSLKDYMAAASLENRIRQLEHERDALLADLRNMCSCKKCSHYLNYDNQDICKDCWLRTIPGQPESAHRTNWEWRGCQQTSVEADRHES